MEVQRGHWPEVRLIPAPRAAVLHTTPPHSAPVAALERGSNHRRRTVRQRATQSPIRRGRYDHTPRTCVP